jgi:hypothetical protein
LFDRIKTANQIKHDNKVEISENMIASGENMLKRQPGVPKSFKNTHLRKSERIGNQSEIVRG